MDHFRSFESLLDFLLPGNWSWPMALTFVCSSWLKRRILGRFWHIINVFFLISRAKSSGWEKCETLCPLDPSLKELLLYIKMGVPGERRYYPPEELVWDVSRDSSPRSLRTCLAAHYGLSPDCLLLAKHQPDKHTWEEISSWVTNFDHSVRCRGNHTCRLAQ